MQSPLGSFSKKHRTESERNFTKKVQLLMQLGRSKRKSIDFLFWVDSV
jgi:hypothetical protein